MLQAPPPPTSFPCAPVGCRAISLVVCLRHLFHRSADPRPHMRTASGHFLPLSLSFKHTRAHAPPSSLTSLYLLRKRWCGTLLSLPYMPYRAAFIKMLRIHIDGFQHNPPALRGTLLRLSRLVGDCCVEENSSEY